MSGPAASPAIALPVRVINAPFARAARRRTGGVLDALLAGRGWIALVFVLLAGIVFFNVDLLQMNRDIAGNDQKISALKREIARNRLDVARLASSERIQESAAQMGLVLPGARRRALPEGASRGATGIGPRSASPLRTPDSAARADRHRSRARVPDGDRPRGRGPDGGRPHRRANHHDGSGDRRPGGRPIRARRRAPPPPRPLRRASPCRPRSAARRPAARGAGRASRRPGWSSGASGSCSPSS